MTTIARSLSHSRHRRFENRIEFWNREKRPVCAASPFLRLWYFLLALHDQRLLRTGKPVDKNIVLTEDVLIYKLNNGANFGLFNIVQRFGILRKPGQTGSVAILCKAGIGFVVPHTE